ncbi:GTP pyrophosphokinase [Gammaproteobacteria bacterium]
MKSSNTDIWLQKIASEFQPVDYDIIHRAVSLAQLTGEDCATPTGQSCLAQSFAMAEILNNLHLDSTTLVAAILYNSVQYTGLMLEDITEHFGSRVTKLIYGTEQMAGISEFYQAAVTSTHYQHNIDNIRKMLLAMVDDIRVVLIKLAERLCILRSATILNEPARKQLAAETMAIYAPLTHRLGIAQIKWELEDLAFGYLEPEKYHQIVAALQQHFPEHNQYIKEVIAQIQNVLTETQIKNFQVTGRVKHIYSIYRKIQRKNVGLEKIFDVSAIRIFVPTITDCYAALSHMHTAWQYLPDEFDDYIASPKPNGYRSIHTAVYGPQNRIVEIQIRTYDMHTQAELGIAAHWVYKEEKHQPIGYEAKIAWLRQIMDWQQEVVKAEEVLSDIRQMFNDRVYVFTPQGDILDLPQGATSIDFAYHVHSDLGHRCCGAKINGNIVPLTYTLKTGDRIEILKAKDAHPSRDWLTPSLGFLHTSRARSKVFHWFKKQSQERNIHQGEELLNKEMQRLNLKHLDIAAAANKLNFKTNTDLLAALGNGSLKFSNVLNVLAIELDQPTEKTIAAAVPPRTTKGQYTSDINIHGIDNLLKHIANCCKPIPGEAIIGHITQGQGVAIHRIDCINALHIKKLYPERFISVSWENKTEKYYPVSIVISAFDRQGLVRDITDILANAGISVVGLNFDLDKKDATANIKITIEISGLKSLSQVLNQISQLPNIIEVRRSN